MDIAAEIAAFDGKRTDVLEALAARLTPDARIVDGLCALAGRDDTNFQSGATWLLKRFQEGGASFTPEQVGRLLDLLAQVSSWDAKLHLLQMLHHWDVPQSVAETLVSVMKGSGYVGAPNKFVRAWAYNGLAVLADGHPAYREEVAALLTAAERDEAASVRARIRAIVREKPWVQLAAP